MAQTKNLGKVTVTPQGVYNASTPYERLDVVNYGGSSWMALEDVTGVTPSAGQYWMQIASKGDEGEKGDDGDTITVDGVAAVGGNIELDAVRYVAMSLTSSQQQTTRENIDAQETLTIDTAMSDASTNPVQNKVIKAYIDAAIADVDSKAPVIIDTASGDIASVTDAANNMPVKDLVANITPVQDLHGQDAPYPAGGGKNLLNSGVSSQTINQLTITANEDGTFSVNGTASAATNIVIASFVPDLTATYTLSGIAGDSDAYLEVAGYTATRTISGNSRTFAGSIFADTDQKSVRLHIVSGKVFSNAVIKPQLELGSSATAFAPYSNICPISGWTGATITRTGKNLFGGSIVNLAIGSRTILEQSSYRGFYCRIVGGESYTVSRKANESNRFRVTFTAEEPANNVPFLSPYSEFDSALYGTVTAPADANWIFVYLSNQSDNCNADNYMIELGSTVSPYEPYVGTTYPVSWQTEAGTVYGGTIDPITGVLTVDSGIVDLGSVDWTYNSTYIRFENTSIRYMTANGIKVPSDNGVVLEGLLSSAYKTVSDNGTASPNNDSSVGVSVVGLVHIRDTRYTDPSAFKTAVNGVKMVYPFNTPQTYQLSPQTISTVLGNMNVWADCGSIASLDYPCDTKLYIDAKTAALLAVISEE